MNYMEVLSLGFQGTVQWVLYHGYPFIFLIMLIEGPAVTAAAAFAAALGYLNVWIVLILSVLANLIPDAICYAIGYWGRQKFIDRYGHYIGITPEKILIVEKLLSEHSKKALFAIKLIPLLATPGLIVAGITKMDIKKYAFWCTVITIPSSLLYLILGYYFGAAYVTIDHYLHLGLYTLIVGSALIIAIIYLQRRYFNGLIKKIEA
jgi:membrane protein DedA with SNARE-associated domain